MRTWQLTLTPAPGEPTITRTVDREGLVEVLQSATVGDLPGDAELAVEELPARRTAPELALAA